MSTAFHGELDEAEASIEEAATRQVAEGQAPHGWVLGLRALVAHRRGHLDQAAAQFAAALPHLRPTGDRPDLGDALAIYLGDVECDRGDVAAGLERYRQALDLWVELNDGWGIANALVGMADVAAASGQFHETARLLGAAEALYDAAGIVLPPHDRPNYGRALEKARAQLGGVAFAAAGEEGHALTLEAAVAAGRAIQSTAAGSPPAISVVASPTGPALGLFDLTFREQEVLALLCQRLTDSEIAARLFISPKTAGHHVSNILAKLGAANRREAAAIAARRGLV